MVLTWPAYGLPIRASPFEFFEKVCYMTTSAVSEVQRVVRQGVKKGLHLTFLRVLLAFVKH